MEQQDGSWHPDPAGRYAQRWWTGTQWSDSVADTTGTVTTDPLGLQPAHMTATTVADHTPIQFSAAPGPVVVGGPPLVDRKGRWAVGLLMTVAGAGLLVFSMFSLDWYDDIGGQSRGFSEARDLYDSANSSGASYSELYMSFGWMIGLGLVGLAVLVSAVRALPMLRMVLGPCVIAGLAHTLTIVDLYQLNILGDFKVLPGAWVGVAGYTAALTGTVVAASSRP